MTSSEIKTISEKKLDKAYYNRESFDLDREYNENISMSSLYEEKISKFFYKEPAPNSDIEEFRLYLQQFNTRWGSDFYSLLFYHFKIRYRSKTGILILNVDGKCVMTSENMTLSEFAQKVRDYIFEKADNFTLLCERDKTIYLLKHMGIKKVDFSTKSYSWISRPDFWILSKTVDFKNINNMILSLASYKEIYFLKKYIPYMIFYIIGNFGIFLNRTSPYSIANNSKNFRIFDSLKHYCKFFPEKLVAEKFLKSNYDENCEFSYWLTTGQKIYRIFEEYNIYEAIINF